MKKFLSLVFLSLFVSTGYAAAGGNIAGTIKGPDGAPFKAAFVRAQNVQTKMVTIVLSNAQGKYLVNNLTPGTYEVWANCVD
jgi:Carboxypeptidase regulatory-like domain